MKNLTLFCAVVLFLVQSVMGQTSKTVMADNTTGVLRWPTNLWVVESTNILAGLATTGSGFTLSTNQIPITDLMDYLQPLDSDLTVLGGIGSGSAGQVIWHDGTRWTNSSVNVFQGTNGTLTIIAGIGSGSSGQLIWHDGTRWTNSAANPFQATNTTLTAWAAIPTANKQDTLVNSSGLAGALSDETGSGLSVFNTNADLYSSTVYNGTLYVNTNSSSGLWFTTNAVGELPSKQRGIVNGLGLFSDNWPVLIDGSGNPVTNTAPSSSSLLTLATADLQYAGSHGRTNIGLDAAAPSSVITNLLTATTAAAADLILTSTRYVATLDDLPTCNGVTGPSTVIVTDTNRGGIFTYTSTALSTNAGVVFASAGSGRWVRQSDGLVVNVRWFGATGDGTTDDTAAINSAATYSKTLPNVTTLLFPYGTFLCSSNIDARDLHIQMDGTISSSAALAETQLLAGANTRALGSPPLNIQVRMIMAAHPGFNADPDGIKTNVVALELRKISRGNIVVSEIQNYPVAMKLSTVDAVMSYNTFNVLKIQYCDIGIWMHNPGANYLGDNDFYVGYINVGRTTDIANASFTDGSYGQACIWSEVVSNRNVQNRFYNGFIELGGRARGFFKSSGGAGHELRITGSHLEASLTSPLKPQLVHTYCTVAGGYTRNQYFGLQLTDVQWLDEDITYAQPTGVTTHCVQLNVRSERMRQKTLSDSSVFRGTQIDDITQNETTAALYTSKVRFFNATTGAPLTPSARDANYRVQNWGNGRYAVETSVANTWLATGIGVPGVPFSKGTNDLAVLRVTGGDNYTMYMLLFDDVGALLSCGTNGWYAIGGTMAASTTSWFSEMQYQSDVIITKTVRSGLIMFAPKTTGQTIWGMPDIEVVAGNLTFDYNGTKTGQSRAPDGQTIPYTKRLWSLGDTWLSPEAQLWTVARSGETYVTSTNSLSQVVVASATGISNGDYICLETDTVMTESDGGATVMSQARKRWFGTITGLSGTTVTFTPAITNTITAGRRVWTWGWSTKPEPTALADSSITSRSSLDSDAYILDPASGPGSMTVAGDWTTGGATNWTFGGAGAGWIYSTNVSSTLQTTAAFTGSPLVSGRRFTLVTQFASAPTWGGGSLSAALGGVTVGTLSAGAGLTWTLTGVRVDGSSPQKLTYTAYGATPGNMSITITNVSLVCWSTGDVINELSIPLNSALSNGSWADYSANITAATNVNTKTLNLSLGTDVSVATLPVSAWTIAANTNGGPANIFAKIFRVSDTTARVQVCYLDGYTNVNTWSSLVTLPGSGTFTLNTVYATLTAASTGAADDVVFNGSTLKVNNP